MILQFLTSVKLQNSQYITVMIIKWSYVNQIDQYNKWLIDILILKEDIVNQWKKQEKCIGNQSICLLKTVYKISKNNWLFFVYINSDIKVII